MSAIGGIYSKEGARIDPRSLALLAASLESIGPDGDFRHLQPPLSVVFRPFYTDRESRRFRQPLVTESGFILCWNGRLDNRDELEDALAVRHGAPEPTLVLAAYRRWTVDACARLIGDFSLALWDPEEQHLLLATDAFAVRPLFYHASRDFIFWSSQARSVLAAAALAPAVDDEFIAGFLVRHIDFAHSAFAKIRRLEAGQALLAGKNELRLYHYWRPDPAYEIRYSCDREYEEHFKTLFREAVACRLRTQGPVFCDLSGGLDSSSLVCMSDEILAGGHVETPELITVSSVYDRSTRSDERHFIKAVEEQRHRKGLHVRDEDYPILSRPDLSPSFRPDQPNGQLVYMAPHNHIARMMGEAGSRVLLRGFGGDQVLWSTIDPGPPELADLLQDLQIRKLISSCRQWAEALKLPFLKTLWIGGVWPLLPRALQALTVPYGGEDFFQKYEKLLHPSFVKKVDLRDRILGGGYSSGQRLPSQRAQCSDIWEMAHFVVSELYLNEGCVEIRYPFFDRRLVEFILAIPFDQKVRPWETRSILRRAMVGTLPEMIRLRRSKSGPDEAFHRALNREWAWLGEMMQEPLVSAYGYIDRKALKENLYRGRHGIDTGPLLRVLCLEFWLRSLAEQHGPRSLAIRTAA